MTIIPAMTTSVRDTSRAFSIIAPRPMRTPESSPTTMTTQANPSPSRRPVKMPGSADGSTTLGKSAVRDTPSIAAASMRRGSTLRTPKIVLTRIG
jgi:hypothetical protein